LHIDLILKIKDKLKELDTHAELSTNPAELSKADKLCLASKIIRLEKRKYYYTNELAKKNSNPDGFIENLLENDSFENSVENSIVNADFGNCDVNQYSINHIENLNDNAFSENVVVNLSQRYLIQFTVIKMSRVLKNITQKLIEYFKKQGIINTLSLLFVSFIFFLMLKILDFLLNSI
jgi:hypothetical protein